MGYQFAPHRIYQFIIGRQQRSSEGKREKFTAKIVYKVILPVIADVGAQAVEAGAGVAARKVRPCVDQTAAEVQRSAAPIGP